MKHRENTMTNFKLDLRVGFVSIAEIYDRGLTINISKLKTSELFAIPVLLGNGLTYAEKKIKGSDYLFNLNSTLEEVDLNGMQCRWDRIKPPADNQEVVCLIVLARDGVKQSSAFKKVMDHVDAIFGIFQERKPITIGKLKLKATLARIGLEMRASMGGFNLFYLISNWLKTLFGYLYFKTRTGKIYLYNLVELSDTLVIDGKINTVISGTTQQREQLVDVLTKLEKEGEILFGLYVSTESVMSCYVRNLNDRHVHFVDGSEGGYTKAAGIIKQKLIG